MTSPKHFKKVALTAQKEAAGKILIVEGYTLTQIAQAITDNTKTEDKMIKHHLPQNNLWLL